MKELIVVFMLLSTIRTWGQNSIAVSTVLGSRLWSTYTSSLTGIARGVEADYCFDTRREQANWIKFFHVNSVQLSIGAMDLSDVQLGGKKGLFGPEFTALTAMNMRFNANQYLGFELSPEVGVAYESKTFYTTQNLNMIVGSHLNTVTGVRTSLLVYLDDEGRTTLKIGLDLTHRSNSAITKPNDGINRGSILLGMQSDVGVDTITKRFTTTYQRKPLKIGFAIGQAGTVRTGYFYKPNGLGVYPDTALQTHTKGVMKYAASMSYAHPVVNVLSIGAGTDLIYTPTTLNYNKFFQTYTGTYTSTHALDAGVNVQVGIMLGRLELTAKQGLYLTKQTTRTYQSAMLSYYLTSHIMLDASSYLSNFGAIGMSFQF